MALFSYWKILAAIAMAAALVGLYWRYETVISQKGKLEEIVSRQDATLQTMADQYQGAMRDFKAQMQTLRQKNMQLDRRFKNARTQSKVLEKQLARHDLSTLARVKPGLVERRVNDATARVFQHIEEASRRTGDREGGTETGVPTP